MLINHCCRLGAAVAVGVVEIESANAMLAEGAFECGTTVHRFGCVISHIFIVVLTASLSFGQQVCDLRARKAVASGGCCG